MSQLARPVARIVPSLALLLGCASQPEPQPAAQTPPAESTTGAEHAPAVAAAAPVDDRAWHMQETFWMAVRARDAVMGGDLEAARNAARELEQHEFAGTLPADWKHFTEQMKQQAQAIVVAGGLDEAGQAVGALALSCGNCHFQQKAGPDAVREPPRAWQDPPDTLTERMDRHYAGVEQLWQGLVQPSEEAWRNGTLTLTRAPLQAPEAQRAEVTPEGHAQVERVRELAKRARAARSHPERAQIYGELIAACASCHANAVSAPL